MNENADIAIIGGSGVYDASILDNVHEIEIDTPFGKPSDAITIGTYGEINVAFLPRHGKGHKISPSKLNSRANILALKKLGVKRIISASAVGSLKLELKPLDIVVPDQIFDRTKMRESTFFDEGIVVHTGFADSFCPDMSGLLYNVTKELGYSVHNGGTYVCMEGPQFSTRAESRVYQNFGFDIIGMTALPEAKLAREAEICYSMLATVTDYDVWHENDVTIETVIQNVKKNEDAVRNIIKNVISKVPPKRECICSNSLSGAIITQPDKIPFETKRKLKDIIDKYIPCGEITQKECKFTIDSMNLISDHIKKTASILDKESVDTLVKTILSKDTKNIFLMGAGRSGLAAKAFAMRLMHMGFSVYVVGETTTPAVHPSDLVIAVSGSGRTPSITNLGKIAKNIGSKLAVVTSNKDSELGNISDIVIIVPGRTKEEIKYNDYDTRRMVGYPQLAPLGTIFEITALVFLDAVISELMVRTGASEEDLRPRHSVFE